MKKIVLTLSLLLCSVILCFSQEIEDNSESFSLLGSGEYFKLTPVTDAAFLGGSTLLLGTDIYLDKIARYNHKNFNEYSFDASSIPLLDQFLMNENYSKTLSYISYGTLGLTGLTSAAFIFIPAEEWFTIGTMYAETLLLAFSIKEFGKIMINRVRPYMYSENYPENKVVSGDWIQSFPSGHTTGAFAMATFTSYVFCSYFPDSSLRLPLIATSFGLAATTAVLRIASGSHFYSDVVVGAVIGICSGFSVPYFHTKHLNSYSKRISLTPNPMGINCCIRY